MLLPVTGLWHLGLQLATRFIIITSIINDTYRIILKKNLYAGDARKNTIMPKILTPCNVTDKWSPLLVVLYIYLFLKSNTSCIILPCSLSLLLCPSLYFSVPLSTSLSTSHQAPYLKGKKLGPTCGHEPRAHSTCQLPTSSSDFLGPTLYKTLITI